MQVIVNHSQLISRSGHFPKVNCYDYFYKRKHQHSLSIIELLDIKIAIP